MNASIRQAPNDIVTYSFDVDNLGSLTLIGVIVTSSRLIISNVTSDDTSFTFTASSGDINGRATVDTQLSFSNGDVENIVIGISISTKYIK